MALEDIPRDDTRDGWMNMVGGRMNVGKRATISEDLPLLHLSSAALLTGCALLTSWVAVNESSLTWGVLSVLTGAGASLFLLLSTPVRRAGLFLPMCFIGLWTLGFGLASLKWLDPEQEMLMLSRGLQTGSLPLGLSLAAASLVAWSWGYAFIDFRLTRGVLTSFRRWTVGKSAGGPHAYSIPRVMALYGVGLGARLLLVATGRYSYITSDLQGAITQSSPITAVLGHVEFLTTVSLLILAVITFERSSKSSGGLLVLVFLIEVPFGLLGGMRSFIILRLVAVGVIYVLLRRRFPLSGLVSLLLILAFLSPFTNAYREQVRRNSGTVVDAAGAAGLIPVLLTSTIREMSPADLATGPLEFATQRLRFVDEAAIVRQRVPSELDHIPLPDTLVEALTVLVPRAIWSEKPVYTVGLEYARDFWDQPGSVVSSRSPTFPGEAFYRGGWLGVAVLMGGLGAVMAAINRALSPKAYPLAIPLYVVSWIQLMNVEGSLVLLGAGLIQSLLIAAVAQHWALRPRTEQRASSQMSWVSARGGYASQARAR